MEGIAFDVLIAADEGRALTPVEDGLAEEAVTYLHAPLRSPWPSLVATLDPLAVVVDLRASPGTGLATIDALRASRLPILALVRDPEAFDRARALGAVALREPFVDGDVIALVLDLVATEAVLRSRRAALSELQDDPRAQHLFPTINAPRTRKRARA